MSRADRQDGPQVGHQSATIPAIPTEYAGHAFQSRAEARWAVFLDHLGIRDWQYEPEAFHLPSGNYLPDFLLPSLRRGRGLWFEVKPLSDYGTSDPRHAELVAGTQRSLVVAYGMPRATEEMEPGAIFIAINRAKLVEYVYSASRYPSRGYVIPHVGYDDGRAFCRCSICGAPGIEFSGAADRICGHPGHRDRDWNDTHPDVVAAYIAAQRHDFWAARSAASRPTSGTR